MLCNLCGLSISNPFCLKQGEMELRISYMQYLEFFRQCQNRLSDRTKKPILEYRGRAYRVEVISDEQFADAFDLYADLMDELKLPFEQSALDQELLLKIYQLLKTK